MLVVELLQKFGAKEKINSTVIHSTFSKTNGLKPDTWHEGTSLLQSTGHQKEEAKSEDFANDHDQL